MTTAPITFETIMAAIDKLNEKPVFPEGHPLCGVAEVKECPALKGAETIVISGDTAYYWPDVLELKEVKVLRLPELPKPELNFSWDFETTINWEL